MKFIDYLLNLLKGENPEQLAAKIKKKAVQAFDAQISVKVNTSSDLEDKVEEMEEKVKLALANNGQLIEDRQAYLQNYASTFRQLIEAKDKLEVHKEEISILRGALDALNGNYDVTAKEEETPE